MKIVELLPFKKNDQSYSISAGVGVTEKEITFKYILTGDTSNIILKKVKDISKRTWDLWEESCFEAFIKHDDYPWYIEFNFAPTTDWNCFYIKDYRENEGEYNSISSINCEFEKDDSSCTYNISVKLDQLPLFNFDDFLKGKIKFGLTAVIESTKALEYFSLKHFDRDPDFHNIQSFIYQIL